MSRWILGAVAVLGMLGHPHSVSAQEAKQDQVPGSLVGGENNIDPNQPLKSGFQISISTQSAGGTPEPDLSGLFIVDAGGSITLKLVGPVSIRGLTASAAADKVAALFKPYIKDPKVTLTITQVPKPVVFISGAVTRQGATQVNEDTYLAEIITVIGFTDNADLSKVRVIRKDASGKPSFVEYDFLAWLKPPSGRKADESQNPRLADKDFILVPLKVLPGVGTVSVEGDVQRPGTLNVEYGVSKTLREALSLSGGVNQTADRRQVSVRRDGQEKTLTFDYDRIEAGDTAHNISVKAGDIVYVPRLAPDMFINLNGAVVRPGKMAYTKPLTVTQVIAEAGGTTPFAKTKDGRIFRPAKNGDPTRTQIIAFDFGKIRTNKEPDIRLEPGDTIDIPQGQPGRAFDPWTVSQALLNFVFLIDRLR